mgnify:CR=1 FL=1|tara:strand:+ start:283 stop:786 length:504 start_codon:yes stop_codon:yes gene_type:complete
MSFECKFCNLQFKTLRGYNYHYHLKCDKGKLLENLNFERLKSPIITEFLENLKISPNYFSIQNEIERFKYFFNYAFRHKQRQDFPLYINRIDGAKSICYFKVINVINRQSHWIKIENTKTILDLILDPINKRIHKYCKENKIKFYRLLKYDLLKSDLYLEQLRLLIK